MGKAATAETLVLYCLPLIIGTVFSCLGNINIKLDTLRKHERFGRNILIARRYLLLGILLAIVGALLDLSVAISIPVSIRAGFAALSIPIGVILARLILHEHVSTLQAVGVGLAVVGPFVSVVFASHDTDNKVADDWRTALSTSRFDWFFLATCPVFGVTLYHLKFDDGKTRGLLSLISSSFACSYVACTASACARFFVAAVARLGLFSESALLLLLTTIIVSLFQISCMSRFLSIFHASVALPMYQVVNSLLLTITAVMLFQETIQSILGYVAGMTVAFAGLYLVATKGDEIIETDSNEPLIQVTELDKDYQSWN
jgi:hypothetical protein